MKIPTHIAIICDGNRRWAKSRGWKVFRGHQHAVDHTFDPLIEHADKIGVKVLTFWVFSTENWDRSPVEVTFLMNLFRKMFDEKLEKLHQNNVRVKVIGDPSRLDQDIQQRIIDAEKLTAKNTGLILVFAINYGGRDEIIRSIKKVFAKVSNVDELKKTVNDLNEKNFANFLDTAGLPDPDLIVRTSGEQRMSGFMPWQQQYSEFYFPEVTFPDFSIKELDKAVSEYNRRNRRFGSGEVKVKSKE